MNGRVEKRGKVWQGIIYFGSWIDEQGKLHQNRKTFTRPTRTEANAELNRRLMSFQGPTARDSLRTVTAWWLGTRKSQLAPKTWDGYESHLRCHVLKTLGDFKVGAITAPIIEDLYGHLQEEISSTTVKQIHAILSKMFNDLERRDMIERNPMRMVYSPRRAHYEYQVLQINDMKRVLEYAEGWLKAPLTLALTTGARRGEICGIKWQDVNLSEGKIGIRRSLSECKAGITEKSTKGGRPRPVPIPERTVECLRETFEWQREKAAETHEKQPEFVCVNAHLHRLRPSTLSGGFSYMLKKVNLGIEERNEARREEGKSPSEYEELLPVVRFHDLRHSFATYMGHMGSHPKTVQERLGHANIMTTLQTYTHAFPMLEANATDDIFEDLWD